MRRRRRRRGDDRAEVADGVAPALVELARSRRRCRRSAAPGERRGDRDRARSGATGARAAVERRVRAPWSRPRARRRSRARVDGGSSASSKAWAAIGAAVRAGRPRGPPRAGSRPSPSAACSDVPQPVDDDRLARPRGRGGWPPPGRRRPLGGRPGAPTIRRGERRLGRDHVGHVVRRPGAPARRDRSRPTGRAGRGGERSDRTAASVRHRPRIGAPRRRSGPLGATRRPRDAARGRVTCGGVEPDRTGSAVHHDRRRVLRRRRRMQVGLMAPQGWKGEYDGWAPADALGADGRAGRAGRGARLRDRCGSSTTSTRSRTRPTRSRSSRSRCSSALAMATDAGPARPHGRLHRVPQPGAHRQAVVDASTSSAAGASSSGSAPAGRKTSGRPTATASRRIGERMARLGDHLEVITRMLEPGRAIVRGPVRASVRGAINVPKGLQQPRIPIIVGGNGERRDRGLRDQVRATSSNYVFLEPDEIAERMRAASARAARPRAATRRRCGSRSTRGTRRSATPGQAPDRLIGAARRDRPRPGRLLPDALVADARGAGARSPTTAVRRASALEATTVATAPDRRSETPRATGRSPRSSASASRHPGLCPVENDDDAASALDQLDVATWWIVDRQCRRPPRSRS